MHKNNNYDIGDALCMEKVIQKLNDPGGMTLPTA